MRQIVGLFAPLPTPFTDDGSTVGEIRLARLMGWLRLRGVSGFAVCTETGEYPVLSLPERKQLAEIAFRDSHGAPVLVNVTAVATTATLDLAQHASRHGAFGGIMAPPRGDFTDPEIVAHFASVSSHANLPIIVVDPLDQLTPDIQTQLRQMPNLSFPTPANGIAAFRGGRCYTDEFSFPEAVLSPIATFFPKALHPASPPTFVPNSLRKAGTPRVVNAALAIQNLEMGPLRGPYRWLDAENLALLEQVLTTLDQAA